MAQELETEPVVQYHPLDVSTLFKGQVLTIPELQHVLGIPHSDRRWRWKLLKLRQQIESLRARQGLPLLSIRTHDEELVICNDAQAADYNRAVGKQGIRRFGRAARRNIAVDATKLTAEQARAHNRTLLRQAMMLVALRTVRHQALPAPDGNGRVTPKMVCGPVQADKRMEGS